MKEIKVVKNNPCDDCGIKGLYDDCKDECVQYRKYYQYQQGRADTIEEFAHALKETFNNEFPSNYHCTQPYFTLDNVRVLVDLVAKEQKNE